MSVVNVDRKGGTKSEHAYWLLRQAIVSGDLEEGAVLDEGQLMPRLGVGRTPLREAMKRLALEEIIIWPAHRAPYIRSVSAQDLSQIYEARNFFEIPAARTAAERAGEPDISALAGICDRLDEAITSGAIYDVAELDYQFHVGIARAGQNRFLVEAVSHLNCGSLRLWYRNFVQLGTEQISEDHRRILRALRERNAESAANESAAHIRFSHERQLILHGLDARLPNTLTDAS